MRFKKWIFGVSVTFMRRDVYLQIGKLISIKQSQKQNFASARANGEASADFFGFVETLSFEMINYLLTEGTVPVPPDRPFALRLCRITCSGIIASGGVSRRRERRITCRSPKER